MHQTQFTGRSPGQKGPDYKLWRQSSARRVQSTDSGPNCPFAPDNGWLTRKAQPGTLSESLTTVDIELPFRLKFGPMGCGGMLYPGNPALSPREAKLMCEPNVPPVNAPTETTAYF